MSPSGISPSPSDVATPAVAETVDVAVIGAGPAGLMAAEVLSSAGWRVDVYDAMPSVGRKFLMAGKGGMNLTHSEPAAPFVARYGKRADTVAQWLRRFSADDVRSWAHRLGIDTFVGTSGRVFPIDMKAAPLLRAWLTRLRAGGVRLHVRHRWLGWEPHAAAGPDDLRFATPAGERRVRAKAVVLTLGGASWPQLGSDAAWVPWLQDHGVNVAPLLPANAGFEADWTPHLRERFAGQPVKSVSMSLPDGTTRQGEFVISTHGIEGSLVYALCAPIRDAIRANGSTQVYLDLLPDWRAERVAEEVSRPRGSRSMASHLQSRLGIAGVKAALLRECLPREAFNDPAALAAGMKRLPLTLLRTRPIAEVISSAGGVALEALDPALMVKALPGVFCAGEMLDWEAPTGGYLLTACFASACVAGDGAAAYLRALR
ncbi:TIGR03862 family flavoprotein [Pandoraea apista]|uniref:TIGR03862 family flavoprotein n=1 Tax=Pandoraea apista TaxID=93218 RepID=A0ABX9ZVZ3_9BURK|nr:TIGR03862 family flavoprotein [Pandoraea apista]PTD99516.1 aminoacetone oxidase family FAD-binding enzyme [Pandoraea apista]RRJ32397.1 TIGR03862 family flavoprotein [Pandoraea apista]RRJ81851.1 TIGR03862 family flavoprotein [Pandoraea apista]RSD17746.1 TIGR03862 family flavoprotein [Pandoraea apista]RSD24177.1 TIGR03862 family flavoprotein [Pandoraea apista]